MQVGCRQEKPQVEHYILECVCFKFTRQQHPHPNNKCILWIYNTIYSIHIISDMMLYNIMAAVRLIGSLHIYSKAGGAACRGEEVGRRAPGGTQGQQLEEIGESRAREEEPARGWESR